MLTMQTEDRVREFHRAMGHPIDAPFTIRELMLRQRLITEECEELFDAIDAVMTNMRHNIRYGSPIRTEVFEAMLKEACDLQYVLDGFFVAFGLPKQAAFNRVHANNMSKLGPDGRPILRDDGKVLKPDNYEQVNMRGLI